MRTYSNLETMLIEKKFRFFPEAQNHRKIAIKKTAEQRKNYSVTLHQHISLLLFQQTLLGIIIQVKENLLSYTFYDLLYPFKFCHPLDSFMFCINMTIYFRIKLLSISLKKYIPGVALVVQ